MCRLDVPFHERSPKLSYFCFKEAVKGMMEIEGRLWLGGTRLERLNIYVGSIQKSNLR